MKTPIQYFLIFMAISEDDDIAKKFIEQEKQFIIDVYEKGCMDINNKQATYVDVDGEKYYNETFNTK